jgi:hypothetical protein
VAPDFAAFSDKASPSSHRLGLTHYLEVANISDVRLRAHSADTVAVLSGFTALAVEIGRSSSSSWWCSRSAAVSEP